MSSNFVFSKQIMSVVAKLDVGVRVWMINYVIPTTYNANFKWQWHDVLVGNLLDGLVMLDVTKFEKHEDRELLIWLISAHCAPNYTPKHLLHSTASWLVANKNYVEKKWCWH